MLSFNDYKKVLNNDDEISNITRGSRSKVPDIVIKTIKEKKEDLNLKLLSDKIKIKDVMKALNVSDIRTAVKWCKAKSILIMKFGKEMYINMIDFEIAIDLPFIDSLKAKYPESWKELYAAYKKGDYITIAERLLQSAALPKTKFIAPGSTGNNFLKKITKKTP